MFMIKGEILLTSSVHEFIDPTVVVELNFTFNIGNEHSSYKYFLLFC